MSTKGKIAALVADGFQEEEYFLPKTELQKAGYEVEVVSTGPEPVEMYSFFHPTGHLDVAKTIADAQVDDYVGVLVPGGAKSPAILADDPMVRAFVKEASSRGKLVAGICRGSLLLAKSDVVRGKRMTGFNLADEYPDLVVAPTAEAAGATWVDAPVVTDGNLVTSPHPNHSAEFGRAMLTFLEKETK
jgi:protease I